MQKEILISAGIDIGTSTTKLVFSELEVENTAGYGVVPRIEITNKRLLYRSSIYRTPLLNEQVINMEALKQIIQSEFMLAGFTPADIQTGAVIITGETATKFNASEVIHTLSAEAGDFLVATAGADLEGILAAKGSGAYAYSAQHPQAVIANIDIGGGTANIAVYKNKQLLGTCTLHVGGRLVEFAENHVKYIAPPIERWCQVMNESITNNASRSSHEIQRLLFSMCDAMCQALHKTITLDHPLLLGHVPNWLEQVDTVMFSGGVSQFLQNDAVEREDDIGWSLVQQLVKHPLYTDFTIIPSVETVAATVIGTSMQTTEISGATIHAASKDLPIKNCPIVVIDFHNEAETMLSVIHRIVQQAIQIYRLREEKMMIAWHLKGMPRLSFRQVQVMAQHFVKLLLPLKIPFIFVFQQDYGRVFGQTFLALQQEQPVISVDQIQVAQGDYIDIGKLLEAEVVPVVIKTLAFHGA